MMNNSAYSESLKPPHPLNTATLATRVLEHTFKNSHYRVIGSCLWVTRRFPPKVEPGLAIEQFLPDLVVTVSNLPGHNPWTEVDLLYENKAAVKGYQELFKAAMHLPFDIGDGSNQQSSRHINEVRSRIVHVIGSPSNLYSLPRITHQPETTFGKLYYSSLADAVSDRTEAGELAYIATHPGLFMTGYIGTFANHWGYEVPRLMRVTQTSRFRASVVAAMHAADIVTNQPCPHIAQWTSNSCGPNCVVSNVIYDPKHEKVIWQEVYPNNRNITPGNESEFENTDDAKGNGNYVFVVWRKYRGCIKQNSRLSWSKPHVGLPQKR